MNSYKFYDAIFPIHESYHNHNNSSMVMKISTIVIQLFV